MSSTEVQKLKRDEPKVDQQKQEAFDTWLRRCPGASWSHVRDALHKAGEYTLEKKIATNHGLSLVFSEDPSRRTQDDTAITYPETAVQAEGMTVFSRGRRFTGQRKRLGNLCRKKLQSEPKCLNALQK